MDDDSSTTLTRRKFANAGDKLTGRYEICFLRNLPVNIQANPRIVCRLAQEETVRFEKVVGRL